MDPTFWHKTLTDPISLYTLVLAVFTVVLAVTSVWQGWVTRRALTLARDEFLATHRPRIIVREVYWDPEKVGAVTIMLGNQGSRAAKIVKMRFEFDRTDPTPIMHGDDMAVRSDWVIERGSFEAVTYTVPGEQGLMETAFRQGFMDTITFQGLIIYMDESGASYRSVFKRVCRKGQSLFARTANPDDEYSD